MPRSGFVQQAQSRRRLLHRRFASTTKLRALFGIRPPKAHSKIDEQFMIQLRILHLIIGALGLAAFALTGQYMQWLHAGLQGMPDGPRMFLRSAHIYLLWSSLLNFMLGCYFNRIAAGFASLVQLTASLALLVGPLLLGISFFFEAHTADLMRPIGSWAIFLSTAGVAGQAVALFLARLAAQSAGAVAVEGSVTGKAP